MILESNKQNSLQLPFEYHHLPEDGPQFFKSGNLLTITDMVGVVLCTSGYIKIKTGLGQYDLKKKDIFLYSPSGLVQIQKVSEDFGGIVIKPRMDYVMPILYNMVDVRNQMHIRDNPLITFTDDQYDYILSTMLSIEERIKQETSLAIDTSRIIVFTELLKSQMRTLFYEIINIYLINQPLDIKAPDRNDEIMQRFVVSLDMHYRKERNVAFYASEQCLSYSYFSEIIKAKSGVTALKWIINRVIMDAEQMLEYTNVSVKEIAARLSFPTQSFFGKYFKQYVGISPKEYRKKARSRKGEIPDKNVEVDLV